MIVLGIETSCDETAAAVVVDGTTVRSTVVSSQIELHACYGGVVPELAAREHLRNIDPVVGAALREAGIDTVDLDGVAVTNRPGLVPALLVGLSYAKGLATAGGLPLVGVNHFVGHIYSCFLADPGLLAAASRFPLMALVVSGGHTSLILIEADGAARMVGRTLDDAAGEAFDKAAKILDLGYPGGPEIDRLARQGDPGRHLFPRGLTGAGGKAVRAEDRFNFSFSGVKTSLLYRARERVASPSELADLAAGYQAAIVEVLVSKSIAAATCHRAATLLLCGGVACNSSLRLSMAKAAEGAGLDLVIAPPDYCTDNAAMVAGVGYHYAVAGRISGDDEAVYARLGEDLGTLPFAPAYCA